MFHGNGEGEHTEHDSRRKEDKKRDGRNEQGKLQQRTRVSRKDNENMTFMMKDRMDSGWAWLCISMRGLLCSISASICALAGYHFSFDLDIGCWVSQVDEMHCLTLDIERHIQ